MVEFVAVVLSKFIAEDFMSIPNVTKSRDYTL